MPDPLSRRTVTVLVLVVALLVATVGPSVAMAAQQEHEVADGRKGHVDPGREDDESQEFPINITFYPVDHSPGVTNGAFEVYASGLTEDMTVHWVVLETRAFDVGTCKASDASAFGIDRGNDDPGTTTDEGLLTAYKTYKSKPEGFFIGFYKESALAGDPVVATTSDQVVARQNNCVNNPEEPGWYRVNGYINGSTKNDTTTDYTIYATSQYTYVCDCSNREEARQTLGPPPNEQGGSESSTPDPTPTATPTPTPAPERTATVTAEATPTARQQTATATAEPKRDDDTTTPRRRTRTETAAQSTDSDGRPTATARAVASERSERRAAPTTPTIAQGPGFGVLLALLALVGAALAALRRRP